MARLTPHELNAKREQYLQDTERRYLGALRRLDLRSPGQLWPSYEVAESIGLIEPRTVDALVRRLREKGLVRLELCDDEAPGGHAGDAVALTARGRDPAEDVPDATTGATKGSRS